MSCAGGHHSCDCRYDLMMDAIDSLAHLLSGLERYREGLPLYDRGRLTKEVHGIPGAVSVLRRARRITE
jgi:hypothetical protein